jgi:hypothetical protein
MAKRRRKRKMAGKCKIITMRGGHKRKVCWGKNGKIKSNTRAR